MWGAVTAILQILVLLFKDKLEEKVMRRKREEEEAKKKDELYIDFKEAVKSRDGSALDSVLRRMRS